MPATTTPPPPPNNDGGDADCDCCLPLAVVEVVPLHMVPPTLEGSLADPGPPPLSAPMVKLQLRAMTAASLATRMVRGMAGRDDDDGDGESNENQRRRQTNKLRNENAIDENNGDQELLMRIALDTDASSTSSSNSAEDKLSQDMEFLSLDTTIQIQPATTRIIGGNMFLFDAKWDDSVERRIIESANNGMGQSSKNAEGRVQMPIIRLNSDDPTDFSGGVPCWIRGYAQITEATKAAPSNGDDDRDEHGDALDCAVVAGTLVRILPAITARVDQNSNGEDSEEGSRTVFEGHPTLDGGAPLPLPLFDELSGKVDPYQMRLSEERQEEIDFILACHDDEAVRGLLVRMQALLDREVLVGTTDDAIALWHAKKIRTRRRLTSLKSHLLTQSSTSDGAPAVQQTDISGSRSIADSNSSAVCGNLFRDGALMVHNQYDYGGKTLLVETLARHVLKCSAVHVLDGNTLFAEYGANGADVAFESLLHSIVLSAAVGGGRVRPELNTSVDKTAVPSICIVLDHMETFVPPSILGLGSSGDPTVPALNAMVAYLSKLTNSIKNQGHFPFPTKNPMYNIGGGKGFAMPVRVCIVGIVSAPDDGGRTAVDSPGDSDTILGVLGTNRYRLSQPSAKTRHRAFCKAFEERNIRLSTEAKEALPVIAASATSARGRDFRKVARELQTRVTEGTDENAKMREATAEDVQEAMKVVPREAPKDSSIGITFLSSKIGRKGKGNSKRKDMFATVGGNNEAKLALEDALALDPRKRRILSNFGLSPPIGVLLYGPPGTGKTLLAKATALALESESPIGGAFINLQATDIVMGAVGQSEKLVVSSFELARQNTPAVIFIDEMQSLFTERGGSGSSQLASTLLQCMDDVSRWREADAKAKEEKEAKNPIGVEEEDAFDVGKGRIIVLAATNVPWMIDRAFLRPGRFDRVVYVGLPTQEERESILRVHVGDMRVCAGEGKDVAEVKEKLCKLLAKDTDGLSGADLFALCRAAAIRCIRDKDSTVEGGVKEIHFVEALQEDIKPSCDKNFVRKLRNWSPRGRESK